MTTFCGHESCLCKELEFLADMERAIWGHACGHEIYEGFALSRKLQRWVTN